MSQLHQKLSEILEVEAVADTDVLREFEYWDSLTVIAIQAMLDSDYGVNVGAEDFSNIITVGDVLRLVSTSQSGAV